MSSSSDDEGKRIVNNPKQLHHCAEVINKYIERLERINASYTKHKSQAEALVKELQSLKNVSVITINKIVEETDHYQSQIDAFEAQLREVNTAHANTTNGVLAIKVTYNDRTKTWTDVKNKVTNKQLELTKAQGELNQAKNLEHDAEAHAKALEELELKSKKQLERLQALEAQGHLHLEEIKQKEIIERQQLEDISTDLNNRKGQVDEAKGILDIRAGELVKQQQEYNTHQTTLSQKETDLKTTKIRLDEIAGAHTQKLSEYESSSLKLKTIVTEKEELKFKTAAQQQEHEELEKKALVLEDDLAVVTGAKRALAITYNETLTHIKDVHEQLVQIQNDVSSRHQDLSTAATDHTKLFRELNELRAKHAALTQTEHDHEAGAALLAEKEARERQELEALKAVEEREKAEIEGLKAELAELKIKIETSSNLVITHRTEVDEKLGLVKVARDTHDIKQTTLGEHKQAHNKLKTTHLDAQSKHQSLQKKIAQLELKLAGLNKDGTNTDEKLAALAAIEAEERKTIDKAKQDIIELEGQIAAGRAELQDLYVKISEKEREIIAYKESHKAAVKEIKVQIEEVTVQITTKSGILGQLQALVEHGKAKIKEVKAALSDKKSGHHHHVKVIEYSTSSGDD